MRFIFVSMQNNYLALNVIMSIGEIIMLTCDLHNIMLNVNVIILHVYMNK